MRYAATVAGIYNVAITINEPVSSLTLCWLFYRVRYAATVAGIYNVAITVDGAAPAESPWEREVLFFSFLLSLQVLEP